MFLRRMANNEDNKCLVVVLLASEAGLYINDENVLLESGLYALK